MFVQSLRRARGIAALGFLAAGLAMSVAAFAGTADDTVAVVVDQAKVVKLPEKVATIVVGNPLIADVTLQPGFMARSVEHPYLHASFDRVSTAPFLTWQFKTAHHYTGCHWDEGIPTDIRVQVQAEMAVAGTSRAAVVVWIGGREFRLFWEPRDDRFIDEHLIPTVRDFWDTNVRAQVPPPVSSEVAALAASIT